MVATSKYSTVLFDIGGVVSSSPLLAIAAYEKENQIKPGYINFCIAHTLHGAFHKLETNEMEMNERFYHDFKADLENKEQWTKYHGDYLKAIPVLDAKALFWRMMEVSREIDPLMAKAIGMLKEHGFRVAALTNNYIFPKNSAEYEAFAANDDGSLRNLFDFYFESVKLGIRKPDVRIFRRVAKEMNVAMSDIVFLDDIGSNLKAAKGLGMKVIRVHIGKTQDALGELEAILGVDLMSKPSL